MDYQDNNNHGNRYAENEVFSLNVKAGKRTYFFDVKRSRSQELFVVITESRRSFGEDGGPPTYQKNKLHLHPEDFHKFMEGLHEALKYVDTNMGPVPERPERPAKTEENNNFSSDSKPNNFTDISFDDLGS
ncbi:MAG: DUF3276 family protein [Bacteroidota bacterium]